MSTIEDGSFEMAAFISIALGSSLLTFVARGGIDASIAKRLHTLVSLFCALLLWTRVSNMHIMRFIFASIGVPLANDLMVYASAVMSDASNIQRKHI